MTLRLIANSGEIAPYRTKKYKKRAKSAMGLVDIDTGRVQSTHQQHNDRLSYLYPMAYYPKDGAIQAQLDI